MDALEYKGLLYAQEKNIGIRDLKSQIYDKHVDCEDTQKRMEQNNIGYTVAGMHSYTYKIKQIQSAPYVLYYSGNFELLTQDILGIVGPRNHSQYAKEVIYKVCDLAKDFYLVTISGLAEGIDSLSHALSLKNNIPTIAVLGGGIRRFLQSKKRHAIDHILKAGGLILSEYKLDQRPTHYTYPQRNRIIAGLSTCLFVPEAAQKSGTLLTVDSAIAQKKPVYATAHSIFSPLSMGTNIYIGKRKVGLCYDMQEMLQSHFMQKPSHDIAKSIDGQPVTSTEKENEQTDISRQQQNILSFLDSPQTLDNIAHHMQINISDLQADITILEILGYIYETSPGIFSKKG